MFIFFDGITEILTGGHHRQADAANSNEPLVTNMTPAEALFMARYFRQKLREENAEQMTLISDPARRKQFDELACLEQCLLRRYYPEGG